MKTEWLVKDRRFYQRLFALALPMAGQSILTFAVGLADNIMVGQIGDLALSGVYMANQWMTMLQQFIHGFMTAALVIATQYWGKKDTRSIKTILAITAKFAAVTGLLFFASYLFYVATELLMTAMKSVETVGIALYTAISTLIINVVLNYLLIFGKLGFPAMGVAGAAVATLAARIVETGIMIYYVKFRDHKLNIRLADLALHSRTLLKDYIRYGIPVFAGAAVWGINMTGQGAIVGRLGQSAISAISISNNMFQIVSVGVYGVASATAIIIGKTVGSGDYELVKKYAKTLQLVFVAMGLGTAVLMYASHWLIPLMYPSIEPETRVIVNQLLLVLTVMVIGTAYQMSSLTGIVRAGGLTHFVFVNDTIFVCLVVLPLGFLSAFVFHAPVWVVFACLKCDQILKCFVALVKVNRFKWIKNITR